MRYCESAAACVVGAGSDREEDSGCEIECVTYDTPRYTRVDMGEEEGSRDSCNLFFLSLFFLPVATDYVQVFSEDDQDWPRGGHREHSVCMCRNETSSRPISGGRRLEKGSKIRE